MRVNPRVRTFVGIAFACMALVALIMGGGSQPPS